MVPQFDSLSTWFLSVHILVFSSILDTGVSALGDACISKLLRRVLKMWPLHGTVLDYTTLRKSKSEQIRSLPGPKVMEDIMRLQRYYRAAMPGPEATELLSCILCSISGDLTLQESIRKAVVEDQLSVRFHLQLLFARSFGIAALNC